MAPKLKILIVGWFKFPFGSASSSRVRTLAKGLVENGADVHIITTCRIPWREQDQDSSGALMWQGISYECVNRYEQYGRKLSLWDRFSNYFRAIAKSWRRTKKLIEKGNCNTLFIYGRSALENLPLMKIARRDGVAVFFDIVEWQPPSAFRYGHVDPLFYNDWVGRRLAPLGCNGVIAISNYIAEKYARHHVPCLVVPSVYNFCNTTIPVSPRKNEDGQFVALYAGTCKAGDGFDRLCDAIKIASSRGCPIHLDVVGTDGLSGPAAQQRQICEQDTMLRTRVRFLGRVSDEAYPKVLSSAHCLVLPRPDSQIARAAFPTRLPEFLATGRPVLTTDVPDVPRYLDADVHAEIVPGDTPKALSKGLLSLWKDPERATRIGLAGQQRCREVFDYRWHTEKLYTFLLENSKCLKG